MADLIEKELSYLVNGCIFDVHNEVGPGLREECYQKAMEIRLAVAGLPFVAKPRTRAELIYLGEVAAVFEPDLIVSDRLILELKSCVEGLPVAFFRQTINYLKFWKYELGLLTNFADARADIRRIVYHDEASSPEENFDAIRGAITPDER
jgi:GxxExxY protein